jgi:uncharacterized lipoprotein YehR (DUF1307 family)
MNDFIEINGIKLLPKTLIETKKRDFISYSFLEELIKEENLEAYKEILNTLNFNYPIKTPQSRGFGDKDVNENVTKLIGNILSDFLEKKEDYKTITDKIAISEDQISSAYSVVVNAFARLENNNEGLYVKFWDVKRLIKNDYFTNSLTNDIKITPIYSLNNNAKKHFVEIGHKKGDLIYSKINLRASKKELEQEMKKNRKETIDDRIKIIYLDTPKQNTNKEITKEEEIYKNIPTLKERKKEGKTLSINESKKYLENLNKISGGNTTNKTLLSFIQTKQGRDFLTHQGLPTERFLRYVNINFDALIKEEYNL